MAGTLAKAEEPLGRGWGWRGSARSPGRPRTPWESQHWGLVTPEERPLCPGRSPKHLALAVPGREVQPHHVSARLAHGPPAAVPPHPEPCALRHPDLVSATESPSERGGRGHGPGASHSVTPRLGLGASPASTPAPRGWPCCAAPRASSPLFWSPPAQTGPPPPPNTAIHKLPVACPGHGTLSSAVSGMRHGSGRGSPWPGLGTVEHSGVFYVSSAAVQVRKLRPRGDSSKVT